MKKVWILEHFVSAEEIAKHIQFCEDALKSERITEEQAAITKTVLESFRKEAENHPDGYWSGFEGKIYYKQFCECAKAAIRRNPGEQFRVVEGLIEDDATVWPGYKTVRVNEGVMKYLMATK